MFDPHVKQQNTTKDNNQVYLNGIYACVLKIVHFKRYFLVVRKDNLLFLLRYMLHKIRITIYTVL